MKENIDISEYLKIVSVGEIFNLYKNEFGLFERKGFNTIFKIKGL